MHQLTALPFATVSALAFYAVLIAFCFPQMRKSFDAYCKDGERTQLRGFDFLRGLAASLVALGHAYWFGHPCFDSAARFLPTIECFAKPVGIFAVLSGFLIYKSVLSIKGVGGLKNYFLKRFFRIYPIYFVSLLLCVAFYQYGLLSTTQGVQNLQRDIFMLHIFPFSNGANPVYWSLYVEVAFYFVLPLLVLGARKRNIVPLAFTLLAFLILLDTGDQYFGLWKFFVCGVLAAEISPKLGRWSLPAFIAGVGMVLYDFGGASHDWIAALNIGYTHPSLDTLGLAFGTAMLVAALPNLQAIGKILDVFPLRHLGTISYSIYLMHMIFYLAVFPSLGIMKMVQVPCADALAVGKLPALFLPLVILPGALFWSLVCFVFVERPGILLGRFLTGSKSRVPDKLPVAPVKERESVAV
ncbi:MAG: acyltransferase [Candidatus Melainabacteria bacterium]|nr:acyltransferase [Candidatus Melainabacteria bacterium]